MLAQLTYAADPTPENAAVVERTLTDLLAHHKPACFQDSPKNILTQLEKSYLKLTLTLAECGCPNPDGLTVYQLYGWEESLIEKYEASKPTTPHAPKR